MEDFLNKFIHWAQKEDPIRAVILQGSHAAGRADAHSDYDLALFCSKYDPYVQDEKWLSSMGNVWVCVHEKISQSERKFPTRLIIFEGGLKVDFSFYTLDFDGAISQSLRRHCTAVTSTISHLQRALLGCSF